MSLTSHAVPVMPRRTFKPGLEALEERVVPNADVILEWNAVALEVNRISYSGGVVNDQPGPTRASRALAIVHTAMFDAWNSISKTHRPYLVAAPNATGASMVAAISKAARDTLVNLYPSQQAYIDAMLTECLRRVPNGRAEDRGVAVGAFVAQRILADRAHDGSQEPANYTPTGEIGNHDVDPLNPGQGFLTPGWGSVRPFGIPSVDAVPTRTVPSVTSAEYTADYTQVKELGDLNSTKRTTDQTEIGIYWGYDGARGLGDPTRLYNQVVRTVAIQRKNSLAANAKLFALVNIAMADAGIQCWDVKYRDAFWRPIIAIRAGDLDGNPDTLGQVDWQPLGAPRTNPLPGATANFTPPFPAYSSGHAIFGAAAMKMLANFYRTDDARIKIPFEFVSDEFNGVSRDVFQTIPGLVVNHVRQMRPRHFTSFSQAAAENAASRIFLGIHWRFDAIEGVSAGNRIADMVYDTQLRQKGVRGPRHMPSANFEEQIDAYLNNTYQQYFATRRNQAPAGIKVVAQPGLDFYRTVLSQLVVPGLVAPRGYAVAPLAVPAARTAIVVASPPKLIVPAATVASVVTTAPRATQLSDAVFAGLGPQDRVNFTL